MLEETYVALVAQWGGHIVCYVDITISSAYDSQFRRWWVKWRKVELVFV
jgi:hypothetical protein